MEKLQKRKGKALDIVKRKELSELLDSIRESFSQAMEEGGLDAALKGRLKEEIRFLEKGMK